MRHTLLCLLLLSPAAADEVTLKDGRVLEGDVVHDDGKVLKLKVRSGTLTFNRADVTSVVEKPTPEQEYAERSAALAADDAAGHLELGRWCGTKKLDDEAIEHFLKAHAIDPKMEDAATELRNRDYYLVGGDWQPPDVYYPSIGWRKLDNSWYHPLEHAWRLELRAVGRSQQALEDTRSKLLTAKAKTKRLATELEAERGKAKKVSDDLAEVDRSMPGLKRKLSEAESKEKAAEEAVKSEEVRFEQSREGEGGTLGALAQLKEARKKHSAAKAEVTRAKKALADAEKKLASLRDSLNTSNLKTAGMEAEHRESSAAITTLETQTVSEEGAVEEAKRRADGAKKLWEKEKK